MESQPKLQDGSDILLQDSSDAVLCAADGALLWLNERARTLFGLAGPGAPASLAELERFVQFTALDGRALGQHEQPLVRAQDGEPLRALPCALALRGAEPLGSSLPLVVTSARSRSPEGGERLWLLFRSLQPDGRLEAELGRRDLLLTEMSHRIKNHLQLLAALLHLQGRGVDDPRARDALDNTRKRIQVLAALHAQLQGQADPGRVDLRPLLQRLVEDVQAGLLDDGQRIEAVLEAVEVENRHAAALALIASELLTNAIKHGRPASGPGQIRVTLRRRGTQVELAVSDDGPGCEPWATHGRLGTQLVSALAQQLGGRLERSNARPGCRVMLSFEPGPSSMEGEAA